MKLPTLESMDVAHKRVLVRVDFNEPIDSSGRLTGDGRIRAALPTIRLLQQRGARIILLTHFGRPSGVQRRYSTKVLAKRLSELLECTVAHVPDCVGPAVEKRVGALRDGEVLTLENVRFHKGEEENDAKFARLLARLAELYVNEAFSNAHRAHASMAGVPQYLPHAAGIGLAEEVRILSRLSAPKRPYVAVLGGAKVSDKVEIVESLARSADALLIGGAMMFTFLAAKGVPIGASRCERESVQVAKRVLDRFSKKIVLPVDVRGSTSVEGRARTVEVEKIPTDFAGFDIGPKSVELFVGKVHAAKTVFWNGPVGLVEVEKYASGTKALARAMGNSRAFCVAGGGDTAAFLARAKLTGAMDFVSTGGGAALTFVAGLPMPGLDALRK